MTRIRISGIYHNQAATQYRKPSLRARALREKARAPGKCTHRPDLVRERNASK